MMRELCCWLVAGDLKLSVTQHPHTTKNFLH